MTDQERVDRAYDAGWVAAEEGDPCVPALCKTFMEELIAGLPISQTSVDVAEAWQRGWLAYTAEQIEAELATA